MSTEELIKSLITASKETLEMVAISIVIALILGTILGVILYVTASPLIYKNKIINTISGFIINIIRSIPFIILLVLLVPVAKKVAETTIGPLVASVPLTIASIAFLQDLWRVL